jgi:trehalose 6-phosphate phosphatase
MTVTKARQIKQLKKVPRRLHRGHKDPWAPVFRAKEIFIFFEFDGTLVEIAPRPDEVVLSERRKRYLRDLLSAGGSSVAIVSGRPVDELRKLVGLDGMFYIGCHGLEWAAPDGTRYTSWPHKMVLNALQSLKEELRDSLIKLKGVLLEDKGIALALHYRKARPDTALTARKEFVRSVHWYQQQGVKLEIVAGKKVIEAKSAGAKKGDAITQILARRAPGAIPIYIGDDITDESAFRAIAARGLAILVTKTARATAATFHLRDPREVYAYVRCLNALWRTRRQLQLQPNGQKNPQYSWTR